MMQTIILLEFINNGSCSASEIYEHVKSVFFKFRVIVVKIDLTARQMKHLTVVISTSLKENI